MQERDVMRAAQPLEPRRASTAEMVERIKTEEAKSKKEPPRGR